jgi:ubiquinone/menaquinone biosynthesis C-methylase UbiE
VSDEGTGVGDQVRDEDRKEQDRRLWASGCYPRIAQLVTSMGCDLVELAGVAPGMQVLDVATGTGNAAIPAALAGAEVTAIDLTPSLLEVGRTRAAAAGVAVDWTEGDAEDLPYPAGSFDLVMSAIGAMFAPDHARTAAELVRVCRRGGRIALANWTPDGYGGAFFGHLRVLSARSAPA